MCNKKSIGKQRTLFRKLLPENFGIFLENGNSFGEDDIRAGIEEKIFNPTHITTRADCFAAIAKRVGWATSVFLRLRLAKEFEGLVFKIRHELHWNAMVDELEEAKVMAGLDDKVFGFWVGQINYWDFRKQGGRFAWRFEK